MNGTAEYYHDKVKVLVSEGDKITYRIRVYNEGNAQDYAGRATQITDYLPDGLKYIGLESGYESNWRVNQNGNKVILNYIGSQIIQPNSIANIVKNGDNSEYYQEVGLVCEVLEGSNIIMTNRAAITGDQAYNGTTPVEKEDKDSQPDELSKPDLENWYKNTVTNEDTPESYYPGEQDDDDFDTIYKASYIMNIQKVDVANNMAVTGANFELIKYHKTNTNGIGTINEEIYGMEELTEQEDNIAKSGSTALTSNLPVHPLQRDCYIIKEIKAATNYDNIFKNKYIKICITNSDGHPTYICSKSGSHMEKGFEIYEDDGDENYENDKLIQYNNQDPNSIYNYVELDNIFNGDGLMVVIKNEPIQGTYKIDLVKKGTDENLLQGVTFHRDATICKDSTNGYEKEYNADIPTTDNNGKTSVTQGMGKNDSNIVSVDYTGRSDVYTLSEISVGTANEAKYYKFPQNIKLEVVKGEMNGARYANSFKLTVGEEAEVKTINLLTGEGGNEQSITITDESGEELTVTMNVQKNEETKLVTVTLTVEDPQSKTEVTKQKEWKNATNANLYKVQMRLYKGGSPTNEIREVIGNGTAIFNDNLYKYDENGQEIIYSIKEELAQYRTSVTSNTWINLEEGKDYVADEENGVFVNTVINPGEYSVVIKKVDPKRKPVGGVIFKVNGNRTKATNNKTGTTVVESAKKITKENVTDIDQYTVSEVMLPTNSNLIKLKGSVVVNVKKKLDTTNNKYIVESATFADGTTTMQVELEDSTMATATVNVENNNLITITIPNNTVKGNFNMKLIKQDATNESLTIPNAGFNIEIIDVTNTSTKTVYKTTQVGGDKTDSNGEINLGPFDIEGENRKYQINIHEATVPSGYIPAEDITINATTKKINNRYELVPDNSQANVTITAQKIDAKIKETPKKGKYNINIRKVDEKGNLIRDKVAKFQVDYGTWTAGINQGEFNLYSAYTYSDSGSLNILLNDGTTRRSTINGVINESNIKIDKQQIGKTYYWVIEEIEQPEGYVKFDGKIVVPVTFEETQDGYKVNYSNDAKLIKDGRVTDLNNVGVTLNSSTETINIEVKNPKETEEGSYQIDLVKYGKKVTGEREQLNGVEFHLIGGKVNGATLQDSAKKQPLSESNYYTFYSSKENTTEIFNVNDIKKDKVSEDDSFILKEMGISSETGYYNGLTDNIELSITKGSKKEGTNTVKYVKSVTLKIGSDTKTVNFENGETEATITKTIDGQPINIKVILSKDVEYDKKTIIKLEVENPQINGEFKLKLIKKNSKEQRLNGVKYKITITNTITNEALTDKGGNKIQQKEYTTANIDGEDGIIKIDGLQIVDDTIVYNVIVEEQGTDGKVTIDGKEYIVAEPLNFYVTSKLSDDGKKYILKNDEDKEYKVENNLITLTQENTEVGQFVLHLIKIGMANGSSTGRLQGAKFQITIKKGENVVYDSGDTPDITSSKGEIIINKDNSGNEIEMQENDEFTVTIKEVQTPFGYEIAEGYSGEGKTIHVKAVYNDTDKLILQPTDSESVDDISIYGKMILVTLANNKKEEKGKYKIELEKLGKNSDGTNTRLGGVQFDLIKGKINGSNDLEYQDKQGNFHKVSKETPWTITTSKDNPVCIWKGSHEDGYLPILNRNKEGDSTDSYVIQEKRIDYDVEENKGYYIGIKDAIRVDIVRTTEEKDTYVLNTIKSVKLTVGTNIQIVDFLNGETSETITQKIDGKDLNVTITLNRDSEDKTTIKVTVEDPQTNNGKYKINLVKYGKKLDGTLEQLGGVTFDRKIIEKGTSEVEKLTDTITTSSTEKTSITTGFGVDGGEYVSTEKSDVDDKYVLTEKSIGPNPTYDIGLENPIEILVGKEAQKGVGDSVVKTYANSVRLTIGSESRYINLKTGEGGTSQSITVTNENGQLLNIVMNVSMNENTNEMDIDISIENPESVRGDFEFNLVKYEKNKTTRLQGAEFYIAIEREEGDSKTLIYHRYLDTDVNGNINIKELEITEPNQNFAITITETDAPGGYIKADPISFNVTSKLKGGKYVLVPTNPTVEDYPTIANAKKVTVNENGVNVDIEDEKITGSFKFNLVKYEKESETKLEGAEFEITIQEGSEKIYNNKKIFTNEEGEISIEELPISEEGAKYTVTIKEKNAPTGYIPLKEAIEFEAVSKLSDDGRSYELVAKNPVIRYAKKVEVKPHEIAVQLENRKRKFNFNIVKRDTSDKVLLGSKFTVYKEDPDKVVTKVLDNGAPTILAEEQAKAGNYIYYITENDAPGKQYVNILEGKYIKVYFNVDIDGKIHITNSRFQESDNYYEVYEGNIETRDGKKIGTSEYISVDVSSYNNEYTVQVKVINPIHYNLDIKKQDTSGENLDGANFVVRREIVKTDTTSEIFNGEATGDVEVNESPMLAGNYIYYVTETSSPGSQYNNILEGTYLKIYVKVSADGKVTLTNSSFSVPQNHSATLYQWYRGSIYNPKDTDEQILTSEVNLFKYVGVNITEDDSIYTINVKVINPIKVNVKVNKKIFGNDEVNLENVVIKAENYDGFVGEQTLTTDEEGNVSFIDEYAGVGINRYIVTEATPAGDEFVNVLKNKELLVYINVKHDGTFEIVDESGNPAENKYYVYDTTNPESKQKIDETTDIIKNFVSVSKSTTEDGIAELDFAIKNPQKYKFSLQKVDKDTKEAMNGVKFDLTVTDSNNKPVELRNADTFEKISTNDLVTERVGDIDGVISVNDILIEKSGTYKFRLHEHSTEGIFDWLYKSHKEDIVITANIAVENGKYVINSVSVTNGGSYVNKLEIVAGIGTGVTNERIKGKYDLKLNKIDSYTGKKLDGAVFDIQVEKDGISHTLYKATDDVNSKEVLLPATSVKVINGSLTIKDIRIEEAGRARQETYTITLTEVTPPTGGYMLLDAPIKLKVTTNTSGEGDNEKFIVESVELIDDENHGLVTYDYDEDEIEVTAKNEYFDLALRKSITSVAYPDSDDAKITEEETKDRIPNVITDGLVNETDKTAVYRHNKQAVRVYKGQEVIYTLRVYNEGEVDGYAEEVTDYLPEWLDFVDDDFNKERGWILDKQNSKIVRTTNLSKAYGDENGVDNLLKARNIVTGELDHKEIQIKCVVTNEAKAKTILTNIAEISKSIANDRKNTKDRDSVTNNVVVPETPEKMSNYKNEEAMKSNAETYIEGQEDEDDFEKLIVEEFDLSLRKYITDINDEELLKTEDEQVSTEEGETPEGETTEDETPEAETSESETPESKTPESKIAEGETTEDNTVGESSEEATTEETDAPKYEREPVIDVAPLKDKTEETDEADTTAKYDHPKDPIEVSVDDIITYTIEVYNEGTVDGYATLIKDDIPEGLEFVKDSEINKQYRWKLLDENNEETDDVTKAKYITSDYLSKENGDDNLIKAFNGKELDSKFVQVDFKVIVKQDWPKIIKNEAQISEDSDESGKGVKDRDSTTNVWLGEDDEDVEYIRVTYLDLALRKFITGVNNEEVTNRIPQVDATALINQTGTTASYTHTKKPVIVHTTDVVTYTIRVYNEGSKDGYATRIKDDIPDGLVFLPDNEINKEYGWKLVDENDNEVTDASKAKYVVTNYLSKDNETEEIQNLIKAFDNETMEEPDFKDVKIAFKVVEPTTSDRILINYAQISEQTDGKGIHREDRDSIPNEWKGEDDEDIEKVKVKYFDLALRKWVTKATVIQDGKTNVTETGHHAEDDPEDVVKVDLKKSKIKSVVVKFEYQIRITNEGEIAGYATEIKDHIPDGLKFDAADNPSWVEVEDGVITTDQLKDTLLQPGESAEVTVVLTWVNSETNMGVKVNVAEISKDYNDYGTPDIDSTPNNFVSGEDDIDDAPVMLTVKTGSEYLRYMAIALGVLAILGLSVSLIKDEVKRKR